MWAPVPTARSVTDPILVSCTSGPEPTLRHNTVAVLPELLREKQCHYYDAPYI